MLLKHHKTIKNDKIISAIFWHYTMACILSYLYLCIIIKYQLEHCQFNVEVELVSNTFSVNKIDSVQAFAMHSTWLHQT